MPPVAPACAGIPAYVTAPRRALIAGSRGRAPARELHGAEVDAVNRLLAEFAELLRARSHGELKGGASAAAVMKNDP
jgi:hypothetical protein